ncbi:unnamed protein product [Phytophthora fragariaefolia]|uniref:Unnamed protein product n=1 Tax=Phytophthora fragariaefolia TaxID=1490495 RepID=A0A9W6X785_9STRA|nr:unnamed protein product [Phytophthora fragariaefolia]
MATSEDSITPEEVQKAIAACDAGQSKITQATGEDSVDDDGPNNSGHVDSGKGSGEDDSGDIKEDTTAALGVDNRRQLVIVATRHRLAAEDKTGAGTGGAERTLSLTAVLKAKAFPPKILEVIKAIHTETTVQFVANGFLSNKLRVTSGIRHDCPLTPLLFIITVDLLYDAIESEDRLEGIDLERGGNLRQLRVAGYADDTAIYIMHKRMQTAAISTVKELSDVSGLKLNVGKSAALHPAEQGDSGDTSELRKATSEQPGPPDWKDPVTFTRSTRYLGHLMGTGNTTVEAWERAFRVLRIRLALAETKTYTVHQSASIAAAIIIPKLMYFARHAWPTREIASRADKSIRNFVWRAEFRVSEKASAGWIPNQLAELNPSQGGVASGPTTRGADQRDPPNTMADWSAMGGVTLP